MAINNSSNITYSSGQLGVGVTTFAAATDRLSINAANSSPVNIRLTNNLSGTASTDGTLFGTDGIAGYIQTLEPTGRVYFSTAGAEALTLTSSGMVSLNDPVSTQSSYRLYIRNSGTPAVVPLRIQAAIAQSQNLIECVDSSFNPMFTVSQSGVVNFAGNLNAYRTLSLTAQQGWPSTTSGCSAPAKVEFGTNRPNLYVMDFADGVTQYAEWTEEIPANFNSVEAQIHWTTASASTDNVVWKIQAMYLGDGDDIDSSWGSAATITSTNTGSNKINASPILGGSFIPNTPNFVTPADGPIMQFRVWRDGSNGSDTLASTARLISVRILFDRYKYSEV